MSDEQKESPQKRGMSRRTAVGIMVGIPAAIAGGEIARRLSGIFSTASARENPNRLPYRHGLNEYLLTDNERTILYEKYLKEFVDPNDGQPIIPIDTGRDQIHWFAGELAVMFNQKTWQERGTFPDFIEKNLKLAIDLCRKFRIHPCIYMESMVINGIIAGSLRSQAQDVSESRFQVLFGSLQDLLWRNSGIEILRTVQSHLYNPYSPLFSTETKNILEQISQKTGVSEIRNLASRLKPYAVFEVMRLFNPTMGMSDIESGSIAESFDHIKNLFPDIYQELQKKFPEAVSSLNHLQQEKVKLETARENLKTACLKMLKQNEKLRLKLYFGCKDKKFLAEIGLGMPTFDFSTNTYFNVLWDNMKFGKTIEDMAENKHTQSQKEYEEAKANFILDEIINYYSGLPDQRNEGLSEAFLLDQVFNPNVQRVVREMSDNPEEFNRALDAFEQASFSVRDARLKTLKPIGELEYNEEFQVTTSVSFFKHRLSLVKSHSPRIIGESRNSIYWQTYATLLLGEIAPLKSLLGKLLRPDTDDPYHHTQVLDDFFNIYLKTMIEQGLLDDSTFPNNFQQFVSADLKYRQGYNFGEHTQENVDALNHANAKILGYGTYSAWDWAPLLGTRLGLAPPYSK